MRAVAEVRMYVCVCVCVRACVRACVKGMLAGTVDCRRISSAWSLRMGGGWVSRAESWPERVRVVEQV
ncbi:hypothetical protein BD414DRAFT_472436 [Trametes punicea]|nr:hypothetical protein BD414DRAFT_472436 [Trametes punicea]